MNVRIARTTKNSPIPIERQAEIILETRNFTIQQTRSFIPLNLSPNSLGTLEYNEDREVILNWAIEEELIISPVKSNPGLPVEAIGNEQRLLGHIRLGGIEMITCLVCPLADAIQSIVNHFTISAKPSYQTCHWKDLDGINGKPIGQGCHLRPGGHRERPGARGSPRLDPDVRCCVRGVINREIVERNASAEVADGRALHEMRVLADDCDTRQDLALQSASRCDGCD